MSGEGAGPAPRETQPRAEISAGLPGVEACGAASPAVSPELCGGTALGLLPGMIKAAASTPSSITADPGPPLPPFKPRRPPSRSPPCTSFRSWRYTPAVTLVLGRYEVDSGTVPLSGQSNTASPGYVVVEHAGLLSGTSTPAATDIPR